MKAQKLIVIVAIVCLLVSASVAAMAQEDVVDCFNFGGTINGGTYYGIRANTRGADCTIVGAIVGAGGVRSRDASVFTMINTVVAGGDVRIIEAADASLFFNFVRDGADVVMRSNTVARLTRNIVHGGGSIRVIDDGGADWQGVVEVNGNTLSTGNLRVRGNYSALVIDNETEGNIICKDNENLFASDNVSRGGRVVCSRSVISPE